MAAQVRSAIFHLRPAMHVADRVSLRATLRDRLDAFAERNSSIEESSGSIFSVMSANSVRFHPS